MSAWIHTRQRDGILNYMLDMGIQLSKRGTNYTLATSETGRPARGYFAASEGKGDQPVVFRNQRDRGGISQRPAWQGERATSS